MTSNIISLDLALEQLSETGWTIADGLITKPLWLDLATLLEKQFQDGKLQPARVGAPRQPVRQESIRGDYMQWLEEDEQNPATGKILKFLDQLMQEMNREFFLGLKRHEAHFAYYPATQGYAKHYDQHRGQPHRKVTFILYLNEAWQKGDGGELSLYSPEDENQLLMQIEPLGGRLILFRSDLFPHQVEPAMKARKSLTGWFRSDAL